MKRALQIILTMLILSIFLSACVPYGQPAGNPVSEAYLQTAVAGTLMAERGLAAGAELSLTAIPSEETPTTPSADGTPQTEETVQAGEFPPTPENPWMLQNWCADHQGCVYYELQNRTDSWLQVELKESDTGVTGFFTVRTKTLGKITLIPGQYTVKYTWWCDGNARSLTEIKAVGSWIDVFKCPQGFYQRVDKK